MSAVSPAVALRMTTMPPTVLLQGVPASAVLARTAFALSGLLGFAAVGCLAVNLWHTAHASPASVAED
jgi:hypothetical protein